jgi:hypothetical protein
MYNFLYLECFKFNERKKSTCNQRFCCQNVLKMDEICLEVDESLLNRRLDLAGSMDNWRR